MNRPLNPNGEIALYGKIPKLEIPPFDVAGSPGLRFRSGDVEYVVRAYAKRVPRIEATTTRSRQSAA
jgi:hypothetical protein